MKQSMTDDPHLRRYDSTKGFAVGFLIPASAPLSGAVLAIVLDVDSPLWVTISVITVVFLLAVWVAAAYSRAATILYEDHILIRTAFRTRRVAWEDVQEIRNERSPAAHQHNVPKRVMVLYDRGGRMFLLPHLTEWAVNSLDTELGVLRDSWIRRRGEDWERTPQAIAKLNAVTAKSERAAEQLGFLAVCAGGCAVWPVLALFLTVGLTTDVLDGVPVNVLVLVLVGTFPAVSLMVYIPLALRRRRRRTSLDS
ncbi:PH domain-containing protein [Streptomyces albogriseolus]|uniref:PH domain-containing protein n=1 Tax=Streptomyces albogriseolus TaxID=1887 RepID=UPI00345F7DE3